jgi:pimeloyl-ACP methyl ester carboxylesterase
MTRQRRTFVLVHGAWHGGWCWRRVADRLRASGHDVFTPTLTGLADRSHLMSASIDLDTHIADIVNLFHWEDLRDVVLVGHSYGGWPISGAIEKLADRVSSIVYLDAFFPENGQRGVDVQPPENRARIEAAVARGDVSRPAPKAAWFHVADPKDAEWVDRMMTPQPLGVSMQKIVLTGARERVAKRAYVRTRGAPNERFDRYFEQLKTTGRWRMYDEACGHDMMVDAPDRLVEILLECA